MSKPTPEEIERRLKMLNVSMELSTLMVQYGDKLDRMPKDLIAPMESSLRELYRGGIDAILDQSRITAMAVGIAAMIMDVDIQDLWKEITMNIQTAINDPNLRKRFEEGM